MELRQLRTFCSVAKALSFTRAAERLNYAQSSVTAQIQGLENELGVQLFERLGRQIKLTYAGERLLQYAEHILQLIEDARAVVTSDEQPSGTLTIGAPETLCAYRLPPIIRLFRERAPQVRLIVHPGISSQLRRDVLDYRLDMAFLLDQADQTTGLNVEPLLYETLDILASPQHPLSWRSQVSPNDFATETIFVTEAGGSYRKLLECILEEAGVHPVDRLEFSSVEAIKQCVTTGMGITLLPRMAVAEEVRKGTLNALPWSGASLYVMTQIAWRSDKWLSPALHTLLEVSRVVFGSMAALTDEPLGRSPTALKAVA